MIFIDANLFIAYANKNDLHHKRALQIFEEIEQEKFGLPLTSDYIFNEVVGVICRKVSKEESIRVGNFIKESTLLLNTTKEVMEEAWTMFKESHSKLSFIDCSIIIFSKIEKVEFIATIDKEFLKISELKIIENLAKSDSPMSPK